MRVKKYLGTAILMSAALCLSGCGESFPELTEEEYAQTVEFAVGLLMKYSNNGQNKLTYVDAKELAKQRQKEEQAKAKEEAAKEQVEEKTQPKEETPVETPEETVKPAEDSSQDISATLDSSEGQEPEAASHSSKDASSEEKSTETTEEIKEDPDAIVLSSDDTQEILDDVFLSYQGYSVSSSYPESSKSYVINADKGKKLLVLRFDLYNGSDSDKNVNLLSKNILFQIILNGKNLGYTSVTFLPNDLSSYVGTIDSRAHESLVVLTEIDQDVSTQIQTLGMIVTIDGTDQKVSLK